MARKPRAVANQEGIIIAHTEELSVRIESGSDLGVDLLPDVLRQLNAMVRLLVEFAVDPRIARVQVVSLDKHSPLTANLRVVSIDESPVKISGSSHRKTRVKASTEPFRRLERAYTALAKPNPPKTLDPIGWVSLGDFARQLKGDTAYIHTSKAEMVIDSRTADEIARKMGPVYKSRGTITGILEGINVHTKPWSFTIYPKVGPARVRCTFDEDAFPGVQHGIRKIVTVTGLKEFVGDSPWPIRMEAERVEVRENAREGAWLEIVDSMSALWDQAQEDERLMVAEAFA